MDEELLRWSIPVALGGVAVASLFSSLLFNVSGTWERVREPGEEHKGPPERLTLGQLGPFVRGRREVSGGWQEYGGSMWGRSVTLLRRDFGVDALTKSNFPEVLAKKLHGDVFAELKLMLVEDGTMLRGTFMPQKIDFLLAPPRITERRWLTPVPRSYRRVSAVELEEERTLGMAG